MLHSLVILACHFILRRDLPDIEHKLVIALSNLRLLKAAVKIGLVVKFSVCVLFLI